MRAVDHEPPPWRLRDLRGRDRALALAVLALALVPFVVALVRALNDGWVPSGDEANIATRSLDVFSRHPPLTGLPSTSYLYGQGVFARHPGPIEFYLLAVPVRVAGETLGPLLTAAAINAAAVLVTLWVFLRRAGLIVMLLAGVLMQAVMWSAGTAVLTDTLSSNMPLYSVLCTAVLVWAITDGDFKLLPLAVVVASYAAQQHLAAASLVGALVAVGAIGLVVDAVLHARRGDPATVKRMLWWTLGALGAAAVLWLPVVIDQATAHPGNVTAIIRYARDANRPTQGLGSGFRQVVHAIAPPTLLARTDSTGFTFVDPVAAWKTVAAAVVVVALVALAVLVRRRRPALTRFVVVTLVVLAVAAVNGSNVPASVEESRINLYRWGWTAAFMTWTALGWGVVVLSTPFVRRLRIGRRAEWLAPVALLTVAGCIAVSTVVVSGSDDHNRELPAFAFEPRVASAVLRNIDHHRPVVLTFDGAAATDIAFYVVFRLTEAGVPVQIEPKSEPFYGSHRKFRPESSPAALVFRSGPSRLPTPPGRVISDEVFDPEYTALLDELTTSASAEKLELAPDANAILERNYTPVARSWILELLGKYEHLETRPVVANPVFLKLALDGVLRSPQFDLAKVRRLLVVAARQRRVLDDERLEVSVLTPEELRKTRVAGLPSSAR